MLALRPTPASKPRSVQQQKAKGTAAQRDKGNDLDEEDDLIEQLNRKLSNVSLNPTTSIPDEMNLADISTMAKDVLPRIDNVLALDCVHLFISFLGMSEYPDLQYETAWVVTNIAAGTTAQTAKLVLAGILTPLIHNLRVSRCVHVQTQTIWALGNISGDGPPYRDLILQSGALEVIMSLIQMCEDPTVAKEQRYMILRIAVWCVSNLCRGSGRCAPEWLQVTPAFPMLRRLMYTDDTEILADTCWAMCRILNGTHKMNLESVLIDKELCARFVELLHEPHATIQVPSLRSLINIASGPEHHTQLLIDAEAIPILGSEELLMHRNSTIRRDALLGISNITAGTADQVREVTVQDNGNVMRRVLDILRRGDIGSEEIPSGLGGANGGRLEDGGDWRVLREAAWVVSNATSVLDLEITGFDLLPSIAQLIDPRENRKASYILPPMGLMHPPLLTKLLDIIFNVLRCNENHPKEQFMKMWVIDCEGGTILLDLLQILSQQQAIQEASKGNNDNDGNNINNGGIRHLDSHKILPRQLLQLRLGGGDDGSLGGKVEGALGHHALPLLGPSVKKRVETILENFFEFGPENDGFGPFFSERQHGPGHERRPRRDDYGPDFPDDDGEEDLEEEYERTSGGKNGHYTSRGHDHDIDFDIDEMEDRVNRMHLL
ncbi:Importin alpha subunit (Karyopherin alpha subunit) (Serine-rich RNA polymerase I suppressor protein) [Lunasporangiospora selenospora]|uniref:Importin alpha subunit (Karyopherin alpha subunit) (Serine-rich RNA polymerase I suppressor protein) n=1 Tax=Lunasporangiospora selenospora TaxID=979761 RepID=A0A9P6FRG9_9FUNG|nr:Importin alpha subunit (Karyopherin alpha subunit) (Serine-rich RNA polymerase I suppressor protein) [Lunasporangiospora selenospora]